MAENLDYLKQKVAEQTIITSNLVKQLNATNLAKLKVIELLKLEQKYYVTLGALKFKAKKTSEAKQNAFRVQIADLEAQANKLRENINFSNDKIKAYEQNIKEWLDAVNEGTSGGLKGDDAITYAEQETNDTIADIKAEEQTEAEKLDNEKKKKVTNYILIGLLLLIIIGVIAYVMKNKGKKKA